MRKILPWLITGAAAAALFAILTQGNSAAGTHGHPDARAATREELATTVMPPTLASNYSRAVRAYRVAQTIPAVLDGIHCHCECRENIGHRSLLTCYQSRHGAACDICLGEAEMAATMTQQGEPLEAIREAIDIAYGTRHL